MARGKPRHYHVFLPSPKNHAFSTHAYPPWYYSLYEFHSFLFNFTNISYFTAISKLQSYAVFWRLNEFKYK